MFRLIKNELYKIFHKKFIYVMIFLIVGLRIFGNIILNVDIDSSLSFMYESSATVLEEDDLSQYSKDTLQYLVADKNLYDGYKIIKDNNFKSNSWQGYVITDGVINQNIACMNESKYINKDNDIYEECKKELDKNLTYVKDGNWKYFVNLEIDEAKSTKAMLEEQLELVETEDEKDDIKDQIESANNVITANEYRLKYEIPASYSMKSNLINSYVTNAQMWEQVQHDESIINKHEDLYNKRLVEKNYYVSKYQLEEDIIPESEGYISSQNYLVSAFTSAGFFMIILIIVLGSTTVADEFNKGTVKQLLLKPYTRTKILFSKYLSCLIVFLMFIIGSLFVYTIIDGIFFGFNDIFKPIVEYNFHTGKVIEINTFVYCLINFLCVLPHYLILFTVGFLASILLENSVVGIIIPLVLNTFGDLITALIPRNLERLSAIMPSNCWELNDFLFGGLAENQYSSLGLSLVVDIVLIVVMLVVSVILFKKKDIKNQ